MPIYEYVCGKCGEGFSKLQKMTVSAGETTCPKCGSSEVERKISACAIGAAGGSAPSGPACGGGGG